ncbi:MAG: NAD(P)/FAD-dependent oxidoreductase [Nitrospinae bacterium]|nr:NAD(P)/FAD-dependent oxidoreductase [Nitrospinota bacterium]
MNKIAIIGGGASGLMAAITAAGEGCQVDLFEQNEKVGKKILASGNGRCNISNRNLSIIDYFGQHPDFSTFALKQYSFEEFEKFCRSLGLLLETKEDGKVYPLSNDAQSVVAAFENFALGLGVKIFTNHSITSVEKISGLFELLSNDNTYKGYHKALIATGSEAAPHLGGNNSGYRFASGFGLKIEQTYPSLVQLHIDSKSHYRMAGVKQNGEVTLYVNGKPEARSEGDILFTRYGISGFAILDISQKASSTLRDLQNVSIGVNLIPQFDHQSLTAQITKIAKSLPNYTLSMLLNGFLTIKIVPHLLKDAQINGELKGKELSTKMIKKVVHQLQNWRFKITDTHGFRHAEVSGGGVSSDAIDSKTMEAKEVSGLYFSGEVLDIVGKRGGYNLHFAWASGYLAGKALASKLMER